jgi:ammonium transporter, Amt family
MPVPIVNETSLALSILFTLLVPFAGAGLALLNTGLGRGRSAAHTMLSALCIIATAGIVYFVCGFAVQGFPGGAAHTLLIGRSQWNWIAAEPFVFRGLASGGAPVSLAAWLGMLSVGVTALIPLGSGADRWRLGAACASTAVLAGWTYPLFAHWVWGGWLGQLGADYGLGHGFLDAGGASSIHVVGGLTALSIAWILGPRRGKYSLDGMPAAIPGHNAVLVLFACLPAWIGWLGLNCSGAMLFYGVEPIRLVLIAVNTTLSAAASVLAAVITTRLRFGKPDASLCANGWVGGLVAGSASCAFVAPAAAVVIGLAAGGLVTISIEWLESKFAIDDPGGAISVHAVAGIWGLLALGVLVRDSGQLLAQVIGIATLTGFVLPTTYGANWLLNRFYPLRVAGEGERQGMDLFELGAGAYPELLTHTDEFLQR